MNNGKDERETMMRERIQGLVSRFTEELYVLVGEEFTANVLASLDGGSAANGRARANGAGNGVATAAAKAKPNPKRRKGPIQLCPVPNCKNRAAPIYGMVCVKHKGIAKSKIKKYRLARKAKQAKAGK